MLAATPAARAQQAGWKRTAEASANVLFGAAEGRVAAFGAAAGRADSTWDLRSELRFGYADARTTQGVDEVTARSSRLSLGADYRPFGRVSPFWFGSTESSLQQRIAARYSTGVGSKLTLRQEGDDDLSLSLALLWEQTRARDPDPSLPEVTTLGRWSLRLRMNQRLGSTWRFSHTTFYQPAVDDLGQYTAESTTSLAAALNAALAVTVSLRDRYDTEARARGARSNHDGQVLFGLRATYDQ
jgi:hypothetical protein